MTLQDALSAYLAETKTSMRALSLRAKLNPKAVSDILNVPGIRPKRDTVLALEMATGLTLTQLPAAQGMSYADLIEQLQSRLRANPSEKAATRQLGRLRWLLRQTGWVAGTKKVNHREVISFFEQNLPASVGLSPASYATYKSDLLALLRKSTGRTRKRGISDISGTYRELHKQIRASDLPMYQKNGCGSFFVFLDDQGIAPQDITTDVLQRYYEHRLTHSVKSEAAAKRQTKEMAALLTKLSKHGLFANHGFRPVGHSFEDGRDRFGVSEQDISSLMNEFDAQVAPWALGQVSRSGQTMREFLKHLDEQAPAPEGKKALLRKSRRNKTNRSARQSASDDALRRFGFLPANRRWSEATLKTRRGFVVAAAKALYAEDGFLIGSVSELTDPDVVEAIADALHMANAGQSFPSNYVQSVLKTLHKLAVGFCQRSDEDVAVINALLKEFSQNTSGIAPRNKAKLQKFSEERIRSFLSVSDVLVHQVNTRAQQRKTRLAKENKCAPGLVDIYDTEMLRDVMAAMAHDILLARAPRSANVTGIRLEWISLAGDEARITIPSVQVKERSVSDPDLVIPLNRNASKRLAQYVEHLRPLALEEEDKANPYLFPSQGGAEGLLNAPYKGVLKRACRAVGKTTGVAIHPHLYRHLLGWIWLKDDPAQLPMVQKLLGHKSLQTTLDYYAEIDENLALNNWQDRLNAKRSPASVAA